MAVTEVVETEEDITVIHKEAVEAMVTKEVDTQAATKPNLLARTVGTTIKLVIGTQVVDRETRMMRILTLRLHCARTSKMEAANTVHLVHSLTVPTI